MIAIDPTGVTRHNRVIVAFDLGGTLVSEAIPPIQPLPAGLTSQLGLTPEEFERHLMTLLAVLVAEESRTDERQTPACDIVTSYLADQAPSCSIEDVEEAAWHLIGGDTSSFLAPLPFARELLGELSRREVITPALSNTALTPGIVRRFLARGGLLDYLDPVVLSSDCGWRKPSRHAFAQLEARCGFRPADDVIVFVGNDVERDILPALACGYHALLVGGREARLPAAAVPVAPSLADAGPLLDELIDRYRPEPRSRS